MYVIKHVAFINTITIHNLVIIIQVFIQLRMKVIREWTAVVTTKRIP